MALDVTSYLLGKKASGGSKGLKVEVVQELPTTGEDNVLYLVPKTTTGTNNVFEEYLYINNNWELIGTTDIDLSGYQTIANLVTSLSNQSTDSQYPSAKLLYDILANMGGVDVVEITSSNPFVFEGKKKGIYAIANLRGSGASIYYKISNSGETKVKYSRYPLLIVITNDIDINKSTLDCYIISEYSTNRAIYISTINNNGTINDTLWMNYLSNEYGMQQDIAGKKIFSTIPEQNTTTPPTNDKQFTNKKYVDDSIASAIGTALGGSY